MIEQLDERFLKTQFVVKCSSINDYESLKSKNQNNVSWFEDLTGVTYIIGYVQTQPVILLFLWATINGKRILFYLCISSVLDQSQIEDWLKENCRPRYMSGQSLAYCEAINFSVCLNFCNDVIFEKDTNTGDIIELNDGRRFLILPDKTQIFIGYKDVKYNPINLIRDSSESTTCKIISHVDLTYEINEK